MSIPYMGSKRKLASSILHFITARHNGITDFYDLFGGGGAVSFKAVENYRFNVHYNELNSHVYSLVKYLSENKELDSRFYDWVTREQFFEQIKRTDFDGYSGFVMCCWSFGNNQKDYLYGKDIENYKRLAHEFIVNGCLTSMADLGLNIPELLNIHNIQERRVVFQRHIKTVTGDRFELQSLESLERLESLQSLQSTNVSYENVIITGDNPIIYCDIPYKGKGEYKENGFDHDKFYQWAQDIETPVYISEYSAPFKEVMAFTHRSTLSATANNKVVEKLFFNGRGNPNKTTLFCF